MRFSGQRSGIRNEAKRQGTNKPVLVYDLASVHTSQEPQAELGSVFGKGSGESQMPKSPDTNNGDVGLFPNGARAMVLFGATVARALPTRSRWRRPWRRGGSW